MNAKIVLLPILIPPQSINPLVILQQTQNAAILHFEFGGNYDLHGPTNRSYINLKKTQSCSAYHLRLHVHYDRRSI